MVSGIVPSREPPEFPALPAKEARDGGDAAQRGVRFVSLLLLPMNKPGGLPHS